MYMSVFPMSVCATHVCLVPMVVGVKSSATGVMNGYEPLCECWELKLGPLREHKVL